MSRILREELIRRYHFALEYLHRNEDMSVQELRDIAALDFHRYPRNTGRHLEELTIRIENLLERWPLTCRLRDADTETGTVQLVTGISGKLPEERKHLKDWLKGTKKLIIVDPYFFSFAKSNKTFRTWTEYKDWLIDELLPRGLESVTVYHFSGAAKNIFKPFADLCEKKKIHLRTFPTGEIHDRVLIKDDDEAMMLGTSFGGLGNRIAFVVPLPQEDVELFKRELHRIQTNPS